MNNILFWTWACTYGFGIVAPLITAKISHTKSTNVGMGVTSAISISCSLIVAAIIFDAWQAGGALLLGGYFISNAAILAGWRYHALRTTSRFVANQLQLIGVGLVFTIPFLMVVGDFVLFIQLVGLSLSVSLFIKMLRIYLGREWRDSDTGLSDARLPTVSFAVPARNETHALTKHLKSAVKTDYPKVEFLVLDDCSQDDTAQIIRAFAHDGARFVKGHEPDSSWLGKNHAYKMLAAEASGEYIVFSGVDTRYEPGALRKMIQYMLVHELDVMSVMPGHNPHSFNETLIQPFRYLFMFAQSGPKTPPVLSTLWVIKRSTLKKYGGFGAVKGSIQPELYFARRAAADNKYKFFAFGSRIGIATRKKAASQVDTAIRQIYPLLGKSLARHLLYMVATLAVVVYPMISLVFSSDMRLPSVATLMFVYMAYALVVAMSNPRMLVTYSPVNFVIGVLTYVFLSTTSVARYEADQVNWKDRNVCQPIIDSSLT